MYAFCQGRNEGRMQHLHPRDDRKSLLTRIRSVPARSRPPQPSAVVEHTLRQAGFVRPLTDCCLRPVREERKATGAHGPLETGNAEEASGRLHDAGPSGARDRGLTARSGGKQEEALRYSRVVFAKVRTLPFLCGQPRDAAKEPCKRSLALGRSAAKVSSSNSRCRFERNGSALSRLQL